MPIRPGESRRPGRACASSGCSTLSLPDWRERETWRRRQVMDGRTGALDLPGNDLAATGPRSTAATASSSPATWSPRRAALRGRLGERDRGEPPGGRPRPRPRSTGRGAGGCLNVRKSCDGLSASVPCICVARRASLRASDADREAIAERLRRAMGEGRLLAEELEERLEAVFTARTYGELDAVVADLPAPRPRRQPARRQVSVAHLVVGGAVAMFALPLARSRSWSPSPCSRSPAVHRDVAGVAGDRLVRVRAPAHALRIAPRSPLDPLLVRASPNSDRFGGVRPRLSPRVGIADASASTHPTPGLSHARPHANSDQNFWPRVLALLAQLEHRQERLLGHLDAARPASSASCPPSASRAACACA